MNHCYYLTVSVNGKREKVKISLVDRTVRFDNPDLEMYYLEEEDVEYIEDAFGTVLKVFLLNKLLDDLLG